MVQKLGVSLCCIRCGRQAETRMSNDLFQTVSDQVMDFDIAWGAVTLLGNMNFIKQC